MLKPALRRAWRNLQSVQFGATPAHAVVLGPVDTATGSLLGLLDGTRGMERLRGEARALGLPDGVLERLLGRLAEAGLLADGSAGRPGKAGGATPANSALDPLRADLASLSVIHREPDGALRRLAARRALRVQVRGRGGSARRSPPCSRRPGWAGWRCWIPDRWSHGRCRRAGCRPARSANGGRWRRADSWRGRPRAAAHHGRRGASRVRAGTSPDSHSWW